MKSLKEVEELINQQAEGGFISGSELAKIVPAEFRHMLAGDLHLRCLPLTEYDRNVTETPLWWSVEDVMQALKNPMSFISGKHKEWTEQS